MDIAVFFGSSLLPHIELDVYSWTAVGDTLLFLSCCLLQVVATLKVQSARWIELSVSGSSLLPHIELDVYSWTAVGHTFCLCCLQKRASLQYMFSCLVFETAVTGW